MNKLQGIITPQTATMGLLSLAFVALSFILSALLLSFSVEPESSLGGGGGIPASPISTTTVEQVGRVVAGGPNISTSTNCSARTVTAGTSSAIRLVFGDNVVNGVVIRPGPGRGLIQNSSTTVAYDGALYGCGAVFIYSYESQNVEVEDRN